MRLIAGQVERLACTTRGAYFRAVLPNDIALHVADYHRSLIPTIRDTQPQLTIALGHRPDINFGLLITMSYAVYVPNVSHAVGVVGVDIIPSQLQTGTHVFLLKQTHHLQGVTGWALSREREAKGCCLHFPDGVCTQLWTDRCRGCRMHFWWMPLATR